MAKSKLRLRARRLRQRGLSIKSIASRLIVSSSTVSLWCRDVKLDEKQIERLQKQARDPYYGKRLNHIRAQQQLREEKIERFLKEGIADVGKLNTKELFFAGICLYWAEGFKKDNLAGFSNSDPAMVQIFILWLEKCCDVGKNRLKLRVGLNEQYKDKVNNIEHYWSKVLKIPDKQFQKPFFQKVQWKKIYEHPEDYHGVLRIRVSKSTDLLRKIHGWIEGLKQNAL